MSFVACLHGQLQCSMMEVLGDKHVHASQAFIEQGQDGAF